MAKVSTISYTYIHTIQCIFISISPLFITQESFPENHQSIFHNILPKLALQYSELCRDKRKYKYENNRNILFLGNHI